MSSKLPTLNMVQPLIDVSTGRVINEVQQRRAIWDPRYEEYKNKFARNRAWEEVFYSLVPDFGSLSELEKRDVDRAIQQRWKTARDAYIRSRSKSNRNQPGKKKYFYYDQLSFLDEIDSNVREGQSDQTKSTVNPHIIESNDNLKQEILELDGDCEESEDGYNPFENVYVPAKENNIEESDVSYQDREPRGVKRKLDVDLDRTLGELLKDKMHQMDNDNMTFFMSMLPTLDKFTDLQKLKFRAEVLNAAIKIAGENNKS